MKSIGVVTTSRSDYGIYRPILNLLRSDPDFELSLFVAGMHLSYEFGNTVDAIVSDGFDVHERIEMLLSSDTPEGIAKSMGIGCIGFAQAYARTKPDLLLVLGDRFEMHSAVAAALPFNIPVAHIHGGEITEGAIDDSFRHSITKMSHLHFVTHQEYARRVNQMGEEPWRIIVSGAPSLDNLVNLNIMSKCALESQYNISLTESPLLVTYHPVTLEYQNSDSQVKELIAALDSSGLPIIFTAANADTYGRLVNNVIKGYVETRNRAWFVDNLGSDAYLSLMTYAVAMVGNSSSGIIEAPSFKLPVVNIGTRQDGRIRASNVIDVDCEDQAISRAINGVVDPQFQIGLKGLINPYGNGNAAMKIIECLRNISWDQSLLRKKFVCCS